MRVQHVKSTILICRVKLGVPILPKFSLKVVSQIVDTLIILNYHWRFKSRDKDRATDIWARL